MSIPQAISPRTTLFGVIVLAIMAMAMAAASVSAADPGAPRCVAATNHGSGIFMAWQTPADTGRGEASYEVERTSDAPEDEAKTFTVGNTPILYEDLIYLYQYKPDHPFHQVKADLLCSGGAGEEDAEIVVWTNHPLYRNSTYTYQPVAVYDNSDRAAADPVDINPEGVYDRPDDIDPNQDKTVLHGLTGTHKFVNGQPTLTIRWSSATVNGESVSEDRAYIAGAQIKNNRGKWKGAGSHMDDEDNPTLIESEKFVASRKLRANFTPETFKYRVTMTAFEVLSTSEGPVHSQFHPTGWLGFDCDDGNGACTVEDADTLGGTPDCTGENC